ncbi:hypothetical protein N9060_02340, partial [Arenicella sp.]|nr:hypothetical protein [Arenicella sp.]
KLLNNLTDCIAPGGYLAISSFTEDHFKELTLLQNQRGTEASEKLNFWASDQWREHLELSFEIKIIATEEKCLWFNSVRELLLHLRLTGVNGNARHTWNKQSLSKFEADYRDNFELDGRVPLTYQPIYIIARKKND